MQLDLSDLLLDEPHEVIIKLPTGSIFIDAQTLATYTVTNIAPMEASQLTSVKALHGNKTEGGLDGLTVERQASRFGTLVMLDQQHAASVNSFVSDAQIQINVTSLPAGCRKLFINLPDGERLEHRFGDALPQPTVTATDLAEWADQFLLHLEIAEDLKEKTLNGYRKRLGQFTRWLASEDTRDPALPTTWRTYYATLKQRNLSPYTRKGHYHILKRFGDWLLEKRHLRQHPMEGVRPPKLPKDPLPKAISREHIRAMLAVAQTPRELAILLLVRDTGCRIGEALSLAWKDVCIEEGKATVIGKGDRVRTICLRPPTCQALSTYRETVPHRLSRSRFILPRAGPRPGWMR